ncbi:hypothetical protein [Micromonospora sp. IBHARD004]|uniref:hypothetical protein n=1 Tax=Micromonospora sp. IBHARD004 TaxID=3457764 RepID=UPI004059CCC5
METPPYHDAFDADVPDVDTLEPDFEAEEVDEVDEEVAPIPEDEIADAATDDEETT